MTRSLWLLLACLGPAAWSPLRAQGSDLLYLDGFESLAAYRVDTLLLRDPHLYVSIPVVGCSDITPFANEEIAAQLAADEDGDGFLDSSAMLLFRPLRTDDRPGLAASGPGRCTTPVAGTQCEPDDPPALAPLPYLGQSLGTCLAPLPGVVRPYNPAVSTPAAPCFVADAGLAVPGLPIPLQAVRNGAARRVNPTPGLANGLVYGFVPESVADTLVIELPGLAPRTLSSLLPGGTGACAAHDDRDQHEGVSGWWFHFNYSASVVPYAE